MSAGAYRILYDADCGFCRWTLAWLLRWDRRRRLEPVTLQDPEAEQLLAGCAQGQRMASWHLVDPDGSVHSAGVAIAPLLRLLPAGRVPAAAAARMPGLAERVYRWTADRRSAFGKLVTRGARSRADTVIRSRAARPQIGLT